MGHNSQCFRGRVGGSFNNSQHLIGTYVSCSSPDKDDKTHLALAHLLIPVGRIGQCGRKIDWNYLVLSC
jgi:hypothetical protein